MPLVEIETSGVKMIWQPDTAASREIMGPRQWRKFCKNSPEACKLDPSTTRLFAYGGDRPLQLKGQFKARLAAGQHSVETIIIVTEDESCYPLLSGKTAEKLGLVSYNPE